MPVYMCVRVRASVFEWVCACAESESVTQRIAQKRVGEVIVANL